MICKVVEVTYHERTCTVIDSLPEAEAHKLVQELNSLLDKRTQLTYRVEYVDRRKSYRGEC